MTSSVIARQYKSKINVRYVYKFVKYLIHGDAWLLNGLKSELESANLTFVTLEWKE